MTSQLPTNPASPRPLRHLRTIRRGIVRSVPALLSLVAVFAVLGFAFFGLGHELLVPVLDTLISERMETGTRPTLLGATMVFLAVVVYMVVSALLLVVAGMTGWVYLQMTKSGSFSFRRIRSLFEVRLEQ